MFIIVVVGLDISTIAKQLTEIQAYILNASNQLPVIESSHLIINEATSCLVSLG